MNTLPRFFRWLAFAALADWLIGRSLTRSAIFMPKSAPVIAVYHAIASAGQLAFTLTALLSLMAASWIAWHYWRARHAVGSLLMWQGLAALSLVFVVVPPAGWWAAGYHLLVLALVGVLLGQAWGGLAELQDKVARSVPALALVAGEAYQASHALYAAMRWPGPPPFATAIFNLGEFFAVLSPVGIWWAAAHGRQTHVRVWLLAALPALAFSVMRWANPSMTGILSIWSTGLTLVLPWPFYAASLWVAGVALVVSLRRGNATRAGWALLLLAAGGYAPQLSTHTFLSLVALWLLGPVETEQVASHSSLPIGALSLSGSAR